jgi:hypothetical protein
MSFPARAGVLAIAAIVIGVGVSACGSDTKAADSTTSAAAPAPVSSSSAPPASPAPAPAAPVKTLQDYVKENNIVETPVKKGDPGSPTIELPVPQGWADMGPGTPADAYSGMSFTGDPATAKNPPTIVTRVVKLTGNVDPAKVLEAAPGEVRNLPGFEGQDSGQKSTLSGFDATLVGGMYEKGGVTWMVAQKTVAIPGQDGLYVMQMKAEGPEDQASALVGATATIDKQTKITA